MNEIKKTSDENISDKSEESEDLKNETLKDKVSPEKKKSGVGMWILVILVLAVIGFFALNKYGVINGGGEPGDESKVDSSAIIATVNGVEISRGELDEKIEMVRRSLPEGVADPTEDAAFELQLLDDLVSLNLLTALAEEKKYTVTDDEINAERTALVAQFGGEEAFALQLATFNLSEEELKDNMRNELLIKQLLEDETSIDEITVTDEEVALAYESAVGGAEEAPSLEQVSEMLRAELMNQKSAEIVTTYVEEIRTAAEVEITL